MKQTIDDLRAEYAQLADLARTLTPAQWAATLEALIDAHDRLYPVARRHVAALDRRFVISASEDDADYLYDASSFHDYAGRAMTKKRTQVRQFLASHVPRAALFDAGRSRAGTAAWARQRGDLRPQIGRERRRRRDDDLRVERFQKLDDLRRLLRRDIEHIERRTHVCE